MVVEEEVETPKSHQHIQQDKLGLMEAMVPIIIHSKHTHQHKVIVVVILVQLLMEVVVVEVGQIELVVILFMLMVFLLDRVHL